MPVARVRHLARVAHCVHVLLHHLERLFLRLGIGGMCGDEEIKLLPQLLVASITGNRPRHGRGGVVCATECGGVEEQAELKTGFRISS